MDLIGTTSGSLLLGLSTTSNDTFLSALGSGKMYTFPFTQAAVAAQSAIIELKNPSGSGKIAFLFGGDFGLVSGAGVTANLDGTSLAPVGVPTPALQSGAASAMLVGTGTQAAPTGTIVWQVAALGAIRATLLPSGVWYALPANHTLQLQELPVNTALTGNLRWLELTA